MCLAVGEVVGERVHVGGQARRGRSIDARDMVVDAELSCFTRQRRKKVAGSPRCRNIYTCLDVDLFGCLMRWTRSGGPSSRSVCSVSVRTSTADWWSSSYNLGSKRDA